MAPGSAVAKWYSGCGLLAHYDKNVTFLKVSEIHICEIITTIENLMSMPQLHSQRQRHTQPRSNGPPTAPFPLLWNNFHQESWTFTQTPFSVAKSEKSAQCDISIGEMLIWTRHNSDVLFRNLKFLYFATATGESCRRGLCLFGRHVYIDTSGKPNFYLASLSLT